MTKYAVFVDHNGGFGRVDKVKPLEAQDLLVALKEVTDLCKVDLADIFKVILYEQVGNSDKYKMIMKSYEGKFFCVEGPSSHWEREWETVVRNTREVDGKTIESFEIPHSTFD